MVHDGVRHAKRGAAPQLLAVFRPGLTSGGTRNHVGTSVAAFATPYGLLPVAQGSALHTRDEQLSGCALVQPALYVILVPAGPTITQRELPLRWFAKAAAPCKTLIPKHIAMHQSDAPAGDALIVAESCHFGMAFCRNWM